MKIMIIEDNKDLQAIYQELFTEAGYTVKISSDGLDGITTIVDERPDIVMLDLMMPEMDGYDFLKALNNNTSLRTYIIVVSNLSSQMNIDKAIALGANKYIRKSDYIGSEIVEEVKKSYQEHLEKMRSN